MNTKILSLFILLFPLISFSQTDKLYFDEYWSKTDKDSALFYRLPPKPQGEYYLIQDFYIDGTLQMEGLSMSTDEDIFHGPIKWYD